MVQECADCVPCIPEEGPRKLRALCVVREQVPWCPEDVAGRSKSLCESQQVPRVYPGVQKM